MARQHVRVRFAPSPTGFLHIGGARTALYNLLFARHAGGEFVLRIEDTDRERSTPENVASIVDALRWLELDWDEGPISQWERRRLHMSRIDELIEKGAAYRCHATASDVKAYKADHGGAGFRGRPGTTEDGQAAIRLRVPDFGETVVSDAIRGEARFENRLLDDPVIARSDGTPLYNLAVAVDDMDMEITHVIRGEDHLSNTPKQLLVIDALGGKPPVYAHLPLLHGTDGKKLSKRHGAVSVQELRAKGYLAEAVGNYIALLGWGYDGQQTFFSRDDLIKKFSLDRVSKSPAVFDEKKLSWMNGSYIRALEDEDLVDRLDRFLRTEEERTRDLDLDRLATGLEITKEKISSLSEFWRMAGFLFEEPRDDPKAWGKVLGTEEAFSDLRAAREALAPIERFESDEIEVALGKVLDERGLKPGKLYQPVRVAICGTTVSPGIFESLAALGKDESLKRIDSALGGHLSR